MIEEYITTTTTLIDKRLSDLIEGNNILTDAARYSLLAPGKRLRPLIAILVAETFGIPRDVALTPACALEMIHTYSLIHDDLPAMDNDDLRRGKPALHKAYNEGIAILAGDYLLTYAFEILATAPFLTDAQRIALILSLSQHSGSDGMIGGQVLDIINEGKKIDIAVLREIHNKKTAALITASVEFGAIIAHVDERIKNTLSTFGTTIGIAFQVIDDILDITMTTEILGKPALSDSVHDKATYPSLLGIAESQKLAKTLLAEALSSLDTISTETTLLKSLTRKLVERIS